ncbi:MULTISPECIES: type II secretion system minor pseudopilin GspJ [Acinetobacter]|uniref:Type II secretion system protein J n=1 Tax=Acinetobacter piscicola TaxID=2006115 RepID=A0A4Q4H0D3_9GAMM|nr:MULTISPECIES: type II secretion system minor pseudopilin GspJ [Acinetobacter]MDM1756557.1 type II secretion system minor pseudopilin GspJ [Acinetobacter sp. 256-1]MDM1759717.1 type II secretion system minor pseudopilin GspJ [Acinetobacter sp. 251-1]QOW45711.1 type II secretion system minor pseudopilin GspJ [Acinetobacter piscicola]RYL28293.1 type II secretion system protein GspJ [Acinetobacter piscicola]
MSNQTKTQGFTLIELMVAIAIFAVLAALGWKIFDYLNKVKERNAMHEQNLGQLQEAYQQMQRDTLQIIPVTASMGQQILPALQLDQQKLSFSKTGMTDPLKQGLASFERVEYVYSAQDKKLYRLKYSNLNLSAAAQPLSSVLLNDVDQYQVSTLNPNEGERWPDENAFNERQLPRGIKIKVMIRDVEYEWIFSLLDTEFLREQTSASTPVNNGS